MSHCVASFSTSETRISNVTRRLFLLHVLFWQIISVLIQPGAHKKKEGASNSVEQQFKLYLQ